MKWVVKAFVHKFMSALPNGEALNFMLQKHVTKRLPMSEEQFLEHVEAAFKHLRQFQRVTGRADIENLNLFEFGAGWDLAIPLTYAALGVRNQTIIDLLPLLRFELAEANLAYLRKNRERIEKQYACELSGEFFARVNRARPDMNLLRSLGIDYRAPADARNCGLESDSYDLVTNTDTMEHIPPDDLARIVQECLRILRPGGCMNCLIDLRDHYAEFDSSISVYNFLRFSDRAWNFLFNSPLQYQSRLRRNDYLELFEKRGFTVREVEEVRPGGREFGALRGLKLDKRFRGRDLSEDVCVKRLWVVLQKPPALRASSWDGQGQEALQWT